MAAQERVIYSAEDACSTQAYKTLLDSIAAVPIRTLKPRNNKGGFYLFKYHESTSPCFLTRLPANLLRMLISYNTIQELISLSCCNKALSKFSFDKYISFAGDLQTIGLYPNSEFVYQDQIDLSRIYELKGGSHMVKTFASIRPEFTGLFHINIKRNTFYSVFQESILECAFVRYNDTMEIIATRPCIPNVLVTDVTGETIACASIEEIALSYPSLELRRKRWEGREVPTAIKFIGEKRMLLVQKRRVLELYSLALTLLHELEQPMSIAQLVVTDPSKFVFGVLFPIAPSGNVLGYNVRTGTIKPVFRWDNEDIRATPQQFLMYRHQTASERHDFLFILLDNGKLLVNKAVQEPTRPRRTLMRLSNERLFVASASAVDVYAYDTERRTFCAAHILNIAEQYQGLETLHVEYWKMKCFYVKRAESQLVISWHLSEQNELKPFYTLTLPKITNSAVLTFRQHTVIKGTFEVDMEEMHWSVPCLYVFNFNVNASLSRFPDLFEQTYSYLERKINEMPEIRMKRRELQKKMKEDQRKLEEEEKKNKHKSSQR